MTQRQTFKSISSNDSPIELKALDVPVKLIWRQFNPYISVAVAERRHSQLKNASLTVVPAAHRLQCDEPDQVAKAMLS